jgi:hypothetical protein
MVAAILAGRKTQTRRILKPQPPPHDAVYAKCGDGYTVFTDHHSPNEWRVGGPVGVVRELMGNVPYPTWRCPYGAPGDRLWVRETWSIDPHPGACRARGPHAPDGGEVMYRATDGWDGPWRPSIHMPRWASRLLLEVTEVRVQRLQALSEDDARAEGAFFTDYGRRCHHGRNGPGPCPAPPEHHTHKAGWSMVPTTSATQCLGSARMAFANLWCAINGPDSWAGNPWVWCVSFRRVEVPRG